MNINKKIKALKLQQNWTTLLAFTAKSEKSRSVKMKMMHSGPDCVLVPPRSPLVYTCSVNVPTNYDRETLRGSDVLIYIYIYIYIYICIDDILIIQKRVTINIRSFDSSWASSRTTRVSSVQQQLKENFLHAKEVAYLGHQLIYYWSTTKENQSNG